MEDFKLKQYIEVVSVNGKCKTSYYPSNEELVEKIAKGSKRPVIVKRWILFPDGVPDEYSWCNPNEIQKTTEATATQTMSFVRWLKIIDEEKHTGHIAPKLFRLHS